MTTTESEPGLVRAAPTGRAEARARFNVTPKSDDAVAAGSVGPWQPGGISPFQERAGRELARRVEEELSAIRGDARGVHYSASKGGVLGMTRAMDQLILTRAVYRRRYGTDLPEASVPSRFLEEVPGTLIEELGTRRSSGASLRGQPKAPVPAF